MAFDGITIAGITADLSKNLTDAHISKIAQPEKDELLLTLKGANRTSFRLLLSASPSLPLVYLTEENKVSPLKAPAFCMFLRKHLGGGRILDITQPDFDRIIRIRVEHPDEMGDRHVVTLIAELMGKHSNLILVNEDGIILDSIKKIPFEVSSVREVLPGRTYFVPSALEKENPLTVSEEAFSSALLRQAVPLSKALYLAFNGTSPLIAEEILFRSGIDPHQDYSSLSDDVKAHLYRQFSLFMEDVKNARFTPILYYKDGEPFEYALLPLKIYDGLTAKNFDSVSALLETYYREKMLIDRMKQKSASLRKIVSTALQRNKKKLGLQKKQLRDTENRDKYKVYGELIHTYGYNLPPNASALEAVNFYTGDPVKIKLDPNKTPAENATRYFDKYNKKKRTFEALSLLTQETEEEITYLDSVLTSLSLAEKEADLAEIRSELADAGYVKKRHSKRKTRQEGKNGPLHFVSSDGFDIYVGKNNYQNEIITFTYAGNNDLWFHAKGCPGSHVIVKTEGRDLPDRLFEEAGALAAHFSSNRGGKKVEVDYVRRKEVKKVKGGKPGLVIYHTNYSLVIDSDITDLKRME